MLSDAEIAKYEETGWVVPDYRVPDALLEEADARATAMMAARPDYKDLYPDLLGADIWFIEIAREPGLLEMLGQVLGPDIALWTGAMFGKPADGGKVTPWHQDGEYWPIRPLETATAWVALDDSNSENGCLRVIDGSHRDRRLHPHHRKAGDLTLHQEIDAAALDESRASDVLLKRGQVSIHDAYLTHGSAPNQSSKRRLGLTYRFMPAHCHFDRALAARQHAESGVPDISRRPIYLVKGSDKGAPNAFDPVPATTVDA